MTEVTTLGLGKTMEKKLHSVVILYHLEAAIRGIEMKQLEEHRIWGLIDRNSYAGFWIGYIYAKPI